MPVRLKRNVETTVLAPPSPAAQHLRAEAMRLPSWDLTFRQTLDLELLLNGGFAPLKGFLGRADHDAVCATMRLADGTLWPIPVTLDVTEAFGTGLRPGQRIALRHPEGMVLAVLTVEDAWVPDRLAEARAVLGTEDPEHPEVFRLLHETNPVYVGGRLEAVELPPHHTFPHLRHTPAQLREEMRRRGWDRVVAFQTRNPMHRAHVELTRRAAERVGARILLHPVAGRTKPGDIDYFTRVRCYEAVLPEYAQDTALLSLLPLAMRMAGPREALWHAIIRRNHGATHFIVGRDHAGPSRRDGRPFYGPYDAQRLVAQHAKEVGIEPILFEEMVYLPQERRYEERGKVPPAATVQTLSGTQLRDLLRKGEDLPAWFTYPKVTEALRALHPPRHRQGFAVFFTGLPSSGKSTIAQVLVAKLMELGTRPVTLLDGDIVRKHLSSELTFSKEHRDLNIQRIGFVASEIAKNGGVAVCAPIAPYDATRRKVREMVEQAGGFLLVHVATPPEVCEQRDRKGLWAKARAGLVKGFTGVDDPYEVPADADVVVGADDAPPEAAARAVLERLRAEGYVATT